MRSTETARYSIRGVRNFRRESPLIQSHHPYRSRPSNPPMMEGSGFGMLSYAILRNRLANTWAVVTLAYAASTSITGSAGWRYVLPVWVT